ncbi:hypothetical protein JR334_09595 [Clostridia bacterium]|nr:hypothetical protein JR334_09595 [Clostridia bacterium]
MEKKLLSTIIGFLDKSMAAYDAGYADEAVHMATIIERFLTSNGSDRTLLLLSTTGIYLPSNTLPYLGFVRIEQTEDSVQFLASVQAGQDCLEKWIQTSDYVGEIIFDDNNLLISRKDILTNLSGTCKNQAFDPALKQQYALCLDILPESTHPEKENLYTGGIPYAQMRQIAYEVRESLSSMLETSGETRKKLDREIELAKIGARHYFYEKKDNFAYNRLINKDKRITDTEKRSLYLQTRKENAEEISRSVMLPQ